MKKFLLLAFVAAALSSVAQVTCNIDSSNTTPGISPTPDQFPCIVRNVYYEQVAQILVPNTFSGATIDSFKVTSVSGIPAGMSYSSNPVSQVIKGGDRGCFVFYGTTAEPKGRYDIGFSGVAYVDFLGNKQTIPLSEQQAKDAGFELYVEVIEPGDSCPPTATTGILNSVLKNTSVEAFQNANTNEVVVAINTADVFTAKLSLVNMLGATVVSKELQIAGDMIQSLSVDGLAKGLHFVVLQSGNSIVTKKILIQ